MCPFLIVDVLFWQLLDELTVVKTVIHFTHIIFIKMKMEWFGKKSEDSKQLREGKEHPKISLHFLYKDACFGDHWIHS